MSFNMHKDKESALLELINRTGYKIIQENGQRKYGGPPPNWTGPPPPKGSEVFIGKIPRDMSEDVLVPIFEKVGYIYEMRLMMDFSGTNRGYAFVMYSKPSEAARAIRELNNYPVRPNHYLGVTKSVDNCRLFVGGIPKDVGRDELFKQMQHVTEGVVDVILYASVTDKTKSRGFAFVEYDSHRSAAMARRKLLPGKILLFNHEAAVDWAEPEPEVDEETMRKVMVLYVRGLYLQTSEDCIRHFFTSISTGVQKVKKQRDFCFVHFDTRDQAELVLMKLSGPTVRIDGACVEVTWAKPVDKRSYKIQKELVRTISNGSLISPPFPSPNSCMSMSLMSPGSTYSSTMSCRTIVRPGRGAGGMLSTKAAQAAIHQTNLLNTALEEYAYQCQLQWIELTQSLLNYYGPGLGSGSGETRKPWCRPSVTELTQICCDMKWDGPSFELFTTQDPGDHRYEVQMKRQYIYKVTISDQVYWPGKLWPDKDQAWEDAIQFVLGKIVPHILTALPMEPACNPSLAPTNIQRPRSNGVNVRTASVKNGSRASSSSNTSSGTPPNLVGYWSVPMRHGRRGKSNRTQL